VYVEAGYDWDIDRVELEDRLRELGLPPSPQPWVWIRTIEPCPENGDARLLIIARTAPVAAPNMDPNSARIMASVPGPGAFFTRAWSGYHFEAVGLLRRFRREGLNLDFTGDGLPGRPPMWRSFESGTDNLTLEAALWWQQAYKPEQSGGKPALIAELRWWPGRAGARPFFSINVEHDQAVSPPQVVPAQKARELLFGIQQRLSQGGRLRLEKDPDSEWEAETRRAIAYRARNRCTWEAAALHIGISGRQLRERRARLRKAPFTATPAP